MRPIFFTQFVLFVALSIELCFAPPVTQNKKEDEQQDSEMGGLEDYMEYHRYLKEVVNALESDPDFRQKLEKADEDEIKSGRIADQLEFVSHHVRTRLDEIKRVELERLKDLVEKKRKLEQGSNTIEEDPTHHHVDHSNPHTFEIEDLKKLIAKTTQDLAEADKKRKEEFKRYEMEKEYQKIDKLNHTNGNEREKLEKEMKEMEEKHKKHEKLHEPLHKAHVEEVWEQQDQMQQDFDPKTFFMLHDLDGNGLWDQDEVKALFIKELDKMYQNGAPEDDMRERIEEMERMRESVFNEMDTNKDGFIDYREFMQQTQTNDFNQDHGWQGLDEQTKPYTDEELQEYIRQYHAANQIPQYGQVPPGYPHGVPPGGYQQAPPGSYQHIPPNNNFPQAPPNQQFHPGQVPQMQPQQVNLNTNEVYKHQEQQYNNPHQQNNIPPQQYQPNPNYQQQNVPPQQQQNVPQQQQQQYVPQQQQHNVPQQQQQNVPQQQQQNVPQQQQQQYVPQQQQQNVPQQQQQNVPQQQQQNVNNQPHNVPLQQGNAAPNVPNPQYQQNNQNPGQGQPVVRQHK